jgi:hypothetical protein
LTNYSDKTVVDILCAKILQYLREGIDLDADTETGIAELSGRPITELDALLSDGDSEDAESVISLLMTPGNRLQVILEPYLALSVVTPAQERLLVNKLTQMQFSIEVRLSDGAPAFMWCPPDWALAEFIARLHVTWAISHDLYAVTDQEFNNDEKHHFWIALRNTQIKLTPEIVECFQKLVEHKERFQSTFFEHLELLLIVWSGQKVTTDPLRALILLKGSYIKALRQNNRFDKASRNHNMETLMLQGVPTPTIGTESALHHISMIDNLTLTLFGQIVSVDDQLETVSLTPTPNPLKNG